MIPTSHQEAVEVLQGRSSRKVGHNTYLQTRGDLAALLYHQTDVVTYHPDGSLVLDSGGWHTPTTKERINWGLPRQWVLRQENRRWFLCDRRYGPPFPFADGMTISVEGLVSGAGTHGPKADKALKGCISTYAKLCAEEMPLEEPGPGDCWYCWMTTGSGLTLGDMVDPTDHLNSHMEESYVVPSLVLRALKEAGAGSAYYDRAFGGLYWGGLDISIRRFVRRYVMKRYGFAG